MLKDCLIDVIVMIVGCVEYLVALVLFRSRTRSRRTRRGVFDKKEKGGL